jgi:hypothetical protein
VTTGALETIGARVLAKSEQLAFLNCETPSAFAYSHSCCRVWGGADRGKDVGVVGVPVGAVVEFETVEFETVPLGGARVEEVGLAVSPGEGFRGLLSADWPGLDGTPGKGRAVAVP